MFKYKIHSILVGFLGLWLLAACSLQEEASEEKSVQDQRPNILLILADDLGYSDIGAFGGEISTPNLDALAASGVKMTNMNVHVFCTPTRSMLLSGVNNFAAGIGTMAGEWRGGQKDQPGYETYLTDRVVTVASLLKDSGYHTYISGKWDLGGRKDDAYLPSNRGFEETFILVEGSSDHFRAFPAIAELPDVNFRRNGKAIELPEDFYSSDSYTDEMISFIDKNAESGQPFFGYLAYTAPHYPLQAPEEYIEKYAGVYEAGYEKIRLARIERLKELNIIDADQVAAPPHEIWPSWDELSPEMQRFEARRMQVYAAMVDNMDANIGRIIDHLKKIGEYENTVIVFLSDNGAEGGNPLDWADYYWDWARKNFDLSVENTGSPTNYSWTGPQWAHVSSAPFKLFKAFATNGGMRSPTIISYPGKLQEGGMNDVFATAMDLPATFLELANVDHPMTSYQGRPVKPLEGVSLLSVLNDQRDDLHADDKAFVWEMIARRAVQKGDWKIVWSNKPWGKGKEAGWELYNTANDPAEQNDLSESHPEVLADLVGEWQNYVETNGLIALDEVKVNYTNSTDHFDWVPESK